MVTILYLGQTAVSIEFPKGVARSRAGALHMAPHLGYEITDQEWAYIQSTSLVDQCALLATTLSVAEPVTTNPEPKMDSQVIHTIIPATVLTDPESGAFDHWRDDPVYEVAKTPSADELRVKSTRKRKDTSF